MIYYCTQRRLYFGGRCGDGVEPGRLFRYAHEDINVSDVLTLDDLDSHDLGYDLAEVRWRERGSLR